MKKSDALAQMDQMLAKAQAHVKAHPGEFYHPDMHKLHHDLRILMDQATQGASPADVEELRAKAREVSGAIPPQHSGPMIHKGN